MSFDISSNTTAVQKSDTVHNSVLKSSNEQATGKLNHRVVKPIGAAHNEFFQAVGMTLITILALPVIIAVSAVVIAATLAPAALIGVGIWLACTGGAPLAVAGLIGGGAALGLLQLCAGAAKVAQKYHLNVRFS